MPKTEPLKSVEPVPLDCVACLKPYIPGKPVEELEREYGVKNAVKVASNENPMGPSPRVASRLKQLLQNPLEFSRYPDGNGHTLKNKLTEKLSTEILGLSARQITLGNGSNDILDLLARTFVTQGDEVIFSEYAFAVYPIATQAVGATAIVTKAKNWGHDLNAMLDAISDATRLIFIANPNNPTGTFLPADDLLAFLERIPKRIVVVIDEAYEEYASHPDSGVSRDYRSMLPLIDDFENMVVTRTFSKAYGLAGFRVGYSISSALIADYLNRVRQPFNNNSFALEMAAAALGDQEYLEKVVQLNWQGMSYLIRGFKTLGLNYIPSAGNFVCVETGPESGRVYECLLSEGIITRPIANYQMPNHLRISIGTMAENKRVLTAFEKLFP